MALSRERRRKRRTPRTDEELEEDQEPLPVSKKVRYGSRRDKLLIARSFCPCHAPPPNKGECWDMGTRLGHVIRLASEPLEFGRSFD